MAYFHFYIRLTSYLMTVWCNASDSAFWHHGDLYAYCNSNNAQNVSGIDCIRVLSFAVIFCLMLNGIFLKSN